MSKFSFLGPSEQGTLHGKGDIANVIRSKVLRWEGILDYLGGTNLITWVLKIGDSIPAMIRVVGKREAALLALWLKREILGYGMRTTSRNWQRQGKILP